MDNENHELSSPYYPEWYFADGIGCKWLITAPENHIISLEFNYFEASFMKLLHQQRLKRDDQMKASI